MKNPILVLLICAEHKMPSIITEKISKFYKSIYPNMWEKYCVVCGRKYTYTWWREED